MKQFFNAQKEVPIQSLTGYVPAPEHIKVKLSQKYRRDIALITVWMIGMVICLIFYLFLLISGNQEKKIILGLVFFLVGFTGAGIWRITERRRALHRIEEAEAKKVKIHHLTKGVHLFSAEAKTTEDGETAISHIFYLSKKNLKKYRADQAAKWWLIKINESTSNYELLPVEEEKSHKTKTVKTC